MFSKRSIQHATSLLVTMQIQQKSTRVCVLEGKGNFSMKRNANIKSEKLSHKAFQKHCGKSK
jgi:ribosomal protein L33